MPDTDSTIIREGWLTKQGNYIRNWRHRWFQLREGILYYYKDPEVERSPTNFFVLAGSRSKPIEKSGAGYAFELRLASGARRYMCSEMEQDRSAWVSLLNAESERRQRAGQSQSLLTEPSLSIPKIEPLPPGYSGDHKLSAEDFVFLKVLGKGNYGKVMLAMLKHGDGRYFAVKVIKKLSLIDDESLAHVLAENRVLQTLDHPYLVKLYCSFQSNDRIYFVMDYINGGELFYHIGREKRFSEDRVRFYAAEILLALHYLHQKGVVYRDLKLENILLDSDGHVKITDFGLVKEGVGMNETTSTFCGTPEYLAPEVLEEEYYGRSVDWWALGVVMYELLVGRPPFGQASNMEKLFANILNQRVAIPESLSADARHILRSLMERDHTKRIGCGISDGEEIMMHPFFHSIDFKTLAKREIPPPFKPLIHNALDVRNFDKEFTSMPAILTPNARKDNPLVCDQQQSDAPMTSIDPELNNNNNNNNNNLEGFSYIGDPSILHSRH